MSMKAIANTVLVSTLAAAVAYGLVKKQRKAKTPKTDRDDPSSRWVSS